MTKFSKITIMMALAAALSFAANSEGSKSVSLLKVVKQNTCQLIPIPPPPDPSSPKCPF
jgi:hypothetical protein